MPPRNAMIHPFAQFLFAVAAVLAGPPAAQQPADGITVRSHTAFRHVGSATVHFARASVHTRTAPGRVQLQLRLRR